MHTRLNILVAMAALFLLMPATAFAAPATSTVWWRHQGTPEDCVRAAQAAFAITNFNDITVDRRLDVVSATAGDYAVVAVCIDQAAVVSLSGPEPRVTEALWARIHAAWR